MASFRFDDAGPWPLGEFPHLADLPGVVHAVTTREGPEFSTEATSTQTAAAAAAVAAHRGLAGAAHVRQVHGGTVLRVRTPGLVGEADALVTDTPGLAVVGRSADCPIILAAGRRDDGTAAVGFAHASWRATVRGITTAMIAQLRDAGVPDGQIAVAGMCTICRGERFWSWRAQGERAGRFAGVIGVSVR